MRDEPAEGRGQTRAQPVPFPSCTGPCPCVVVKGLAAHTASAAQKRSADGGSTTRVGFSAVCLFRLDLNSKKGSFSGTCPRAQSRAIALANHLPRPVLLGGGPGTVCFPPTWTAAEIWALATTPRPALVGSVPVWKSANGMRAREWAASAWSPHTPNGVR